MYPLQEYKHVCPFHFTKLILFQIYIAFGKGRMALKGNNLLLGNWLNLHQLGVTCQKAMMG